MNCKNLFDSLLIFRKQQTLSQLNLYLKEPLPLEHLFAKLKPIFAFAKANFQYSLNFLLVRRLLNYLRELVEGEENVEMFSEIISFSRQLLQWDQFVEEEIADLEEFMANQVVCKLLNEKVQFEHLLSTLLNSSDEIHRSFAMKICKKCMRVKMEDDFQDLVLGIIFNLQHPEDFKDI